MRVTPSLWGYPVERVIGGIIKHKHSSGLYLVCGVDMNDGQFAIGLTGMIHNSIQDDYSLISLASEQIPIQDKEG